MVQMCEKGFLKNLRTHFCFVQQDVSVNFVLLSVWSPLDQEGIHLHIGNIRQYNWQVTKKNWHTNIETFHSCNREFARYCIVG